VLERAQLIRRRKDAQWRRCTLRPDGLRAAADWLDQYERFWSESLDRLARYLNSSEQEEDTDDDASTETA
jgi:hypothetical protein